MAGKMDLVTKLKAYACGFAGHPKHSFDFSDDDIDVLLNSLEIVKTLSKIDTIHNFQRERSDIVKYCYDMSAIQSAARNLVKKIY